MFIRCELIEKQTVLLRLTTFPLQISCLNSLCQSKTGLCASANLKNGLKCTLSVS